MQTIFSTREIATGVWLLAILVYMIANKSIRKNIVSILKIVFGKQLGSLLLFILIYNMALTVIISMYLPVWKTIYLKDVVLWLATSGIFMAFNACDKKADEHYIWQCLRKNIGIAVAFEFIVHTFTFHIIIELLIIPVVFLVTAINVMTEKKEEYKQVYSLSNGLLAIIGICIAFGTIKTGVSEWAELNKVDTVVSFLVPIVYLICDVPLIYLIQIITEYQLIFVRMSFKDNEDEKLKRKHKIEVVKTCGLSVKRLRNFLSECVPKMYRRMDEKEFERIINEFREKTNE